MRSADYELMLSDQHYQCAICGYVPKPGERLHIDHDHSSLEVRGILCPLCNTGIGHFKDSPDLLRKAAEYLEQGGHHSRFRVEGGKLIELRNQE